jgi:RNA polymerase sigma factor (sigma-70 family)
MSGAHESLSEFVRNGSEAAFRELVASYMDFVYSTALRILGGDSHLAEDVAQNVFIDLAKKAHSLPRDVKLGGWLHRHTCFLARKALRGEGRRKARERRAVELQAINDCTDEKVALLTSVLDEAIEDLGTHDRTAILLRFFESLDFRSLGRKMGSSEDAARMRVSRALEKLASLLKGRGFTLSVSALTFIFGSKVLSAAPPHFASRVAASAHAAGSKISFVAMLKDACFTKLNLSLTGTAMGIGVVVALAAGRPSRANVKPMEPAVLEQPIASETPPKPAVVADLPVAPPASPVRTNVTPPAVVLKTHASARPRMAVRTPAPAAPVPPPITAPPAVVAANANTNSSVAADPLPWLNSGPTTYYPPGYSTTGYGLSYYSRGRPSISPAPLAQDNSLKTPVILNADIPAQPSSGFSPPGSNTRILTRTPTSRPKQRTLP